MTKIESKIINGIAIIMMLIHHLFGDAGLMESYGVSFEFWHEDVLLILSETGKICVALFVFVSAYGITKSVKNLKEENMIIMIKKRYFKIMFSYWFIFLGAYILALCTGRVKQTYGDTNYNIIYNSIIDMLGLSDLIGTPTLNATWWYMAYGVTLIILVPVVYYLCKRIGSIGVIIFGITIPGFMCLDKLSTFRWYMMVVVFGVVTAEINLYEKIKSIDDSFKKYTICICSCVVCILMMILRHKIGEYWLIDAIISCTFPIIAYILEQYKMLRDTFAFLGKHSMNIFMTHTFIYYYYLRDYIYNFRKPFVIFWTVLLASIILSIIIELIKRYIRFYDMQDKFIMFVNGSGSVKNCDDKFSTEKGVS